MRPIPAQALWHSSPSWTALPASWRVIVCCESVDCSVFHASGDDPAVPACLSATSHVRRFLGPPAHADFRHADARRPLAFSAPTRSGTVRSCTIFRLDRAPGLPPALSSRPGTAGPAAWPGDDITEEIRGSGNTSLRRMVTACLPCTPLIAAPGLTPAASLLAQPA